MTTKEKIAALLAWLKHAGAEVGNIEIRELGPEFRAVFMRTRLAPDKSILVVPESCLMTTTMARQAPMCKLLLSRGFVPGHGQTLLALFLVDEYHRKGPALSWWWPYLALLPSAYNNVPLFYSDPHDLSLVDPASFVTDMVMHQRLALLQEYQGVVAAIPEFNLTWAEFQWARTVVVSRVFALQDGAEGLVPVADMLNHRSNNTHGARWGFDASSSAFVVRSIRHLLKGVELTDSYGEKCNSRYLANYGFVLENNRASNQAALFVPCAVGGIIISPRLRQLIGKAAAYDDNYSYYQKAVHEGWETKVASGEWFRFQIQNPAEVVAKTLQDEQQQAADAKNAAATSTEWRRKSVGACTLACLRLLRVLVANETEADLLVAASGGAAGCGVGDPHPLTVAGVLPAVSGRNEVAALDLLSNLVTKRLGEFRAKLEDDEQQLKEAKPFTNTFNILTVLVGEKRVLAATNEFCAAVGAAWRESHQDTAKTRRLLKANPLTKDYAHVHWAHL